MLAASFECLSSPMSKKRLKKNFYGQEKRSVKFAHRIWQVLNIVIVISPLVSLMKNQANYLRALGIKAESIEEDKTVNLKIENGECNIVYSSPESLLGNGWWTNMFSSDVYKQNIIGIVVDLRQHEKATLLFRKATVMLA